MKYARQRIELKSEALKDNSAGYMGLGVQLVVPKEYTMTLLQET